MNTTIPPQPDEPLPPRFPVPPPLSQPPPAPENEVEYKGRMVPTSEYLKLMKCKTWEEAMRKEERKSKIVALILAISIVLTAACPGIMHGIEKQKVTNVIIKITPEK